MNKTILYTLLIAMLMLANNMHAQSTASFRIQEVTIHAGQEAEISIEVENPLEVKGFQLSVTLPEELEFASYDEGKNGNTRPRWAKLNRMRSKDTHSIVTSKTPKNNRIIFATYSAQNDPFIGKKGEVFKFKIKAKEGITPGVYNIAIDEMEFSDMQNQSVEQDAMTAKIRVVDPSEATTISNTNEKEKESAMYNTRGQRITENERGIVIKDNRKYLKK